MKLLIKISIIIPFFLAVSDVSAQKYGLAAIDSMKALLKTQKTLDSGQVKIVHRISAAYRNIDTDSAMQYAVRGLAMAKKVNWPKGIAAFYDNIGSLYSNNGGYEKAIQYYNASLSINKSIGNKRAQTGNIINIGSVYQRQGDDARALEYCFKALKMARAINEQEYTALLYGNISDVYLSQENFTMARAYSLKAYQAYKQLNDLSGLARAEDRIGSVFLATKKLKEAEQYLQQSLQHYKELDDKMGQAKSLSHIALLHEDDAAQKLKFLMEAQQLFDQTTPLHPNSITNLGNIGTTYNRVFFKTKDRNTAQKAAQYLEKAVAASKQVGDRDNLGYFSTELAHLQENNGQYEDALRNYKRSRQITDSMYSQESKNKIASLEAQYAFQKKEESYQQEQQLAKLKMRQVYLYGALAFILVSSILVYFLNRSHIRHLRLKNELQRKQAEEKNKELINRNKLSESELKAIRAQMNPHFIFNVLNSIESYIVENDSKTASRLVQKFAALSRLILENSTQSMVSADREWKALQLYAELEVMRFNKQFSCSFHADPSIDLSSLLLPPMLVQPLIENAIHHGMRNSTAPNNAIAVNLEQTEGALLFTVADNGIGMDEAEKFKTFSAIKSKSIGISSIKERIEIFNVMNQGHPALFELRNKQTAEGRGTIAKLTLPKIVKKD
ncbi:tetratricopeptide (TPR) repeat protein [Pedobacter sp. AK017]|uniref:tetratricopeptide repeat-containing sensor histidine kinase n=1 Tax=Pedobacter sp. AK017 TaxID=2723073 RepID=UPI0016147E3A|nr:tetratricopeptide repeat protein [Pedobacter sp. AK017]MBB5440288.1 tetratricopeptide (TPR) repeat protein [Pedobacter sp. AK017]